MKIGRKTRQSPGGSDLDDALRLPNENSDEMEEYRPNAAPIVDFDLVDALPATRLHVDIADGPVACYAADRLLIDVPALSPSLCAANGPMALLRRKLSKEPQIHGNKQSKVVFDG